MKIRIAALVLALCMVCSMLPYPAWAAQERSIVSIDVEDVTLMQNCGGYEGLVFDNETGEEIGTYYHYWYTPNFTVTMSDGAVYQGESGWIDIDYVDYYLSYTDDQGPESPWGVGEHEVTATLDQVQTTFTVTIQENPVDRIDVEPITLYEGMDGWMDSYWDESRQEWVENAWFRYDISPRNITVFYKDGTTLTGSMYEIQEQTGESVSYSDPQDHEAPWGVGEHTATATYLGISCDYQVSILEHPVERIEVEPITLREGIDGDMNGCWDEETGEWVSNTWFRYDISPRMITVYYKDGTSLTGSLFDIEEQTGYYVSYADLQEHTAPWGPGTYTATAEYMGITCQYQITITENAVERIEAEPVTILEGTHGYWASGWDEAQQAWVPDVWYEYHIMPEKLTIYYQDGTSFSGYMYEIQEHTGAYPAVSDDQTESAPWGPGVHTATVHLLGRTCEYQVTIQENNVERIEVAPVTLLEGVDGDWASYWEDDRSFQWFRYNTRPRLITVYYKDGTVQTGPVDEMEIQEGGSVSNSDDQDYYAQWGPGTYTLQAQFMGRSCQYQLTIGENDVAGIEVAPVTLYEGISGQQQDGWFEYQINPRTITLRYKDGTSETCSVSDIAARMGVSVSVSDDQSADAPWGVGTYMATAYFMGRSCEFQVHILENPIASISLVQMPEKTTFLVGEWIDLKGAVLRVTFADGTYEDVPIEQSTAYMMSYYKKYPISKLDIESNLTMSERGIYTPGTHTISLGFAGKSCGLTVEILESTITGIAIQSPDGRQLQIVATHEDGATEQFDVLWLEDGLGDGTEEYVMVGGNILTYQGTFFGHLYQMKDGGLYLDASMGPGGEGLRSNTLYGCTWLSDWERIQDYIGLLSCMNSSGDRFTGAADAQNIDALVEIVRCFASCSKSFYNDAIELNPTLNGYNFIYSGAEIRRALEALFAIADADLSLSEHYDPVADTYTSQGDGWGSGLFEIPPTFREEDGLLQVTVTLEDGTRLRMLLDDAYRIIAYYLFETDHDHDYENSRCTLCGEKERPVYTVTYTSVSLSLAGDIGVNYYVQLSPNVVNDPGAYMQFTVADRILTIPLREAEISSIDPGGLATYRFTCKVAAKQMTDTITGQMYLSDGTAVGAPKAYSVKAYCDAAIPTYGQYAAYGELVDLMEAMLCYGGCSQIQFGYNTGNLASGETTLPELTEAELAPYAHGAEGAESGIVVSNVSLLLESTTTIRFYFRLDGTRSIDAYTFYVDGVKAVPVRSGENLYYVDKVNVAAKDLDEMVQVTVGGLTVHYCGLSYVRQVAVLYPNFYSGALVNVAKALYAYNQAANAYFG